jgi:hypothetical protein
MMSQGSKTLPPLYLPTKEEFLAAVDAYHRLEKRGPVYFEALRNLGASWGQPTAMAEAIGLLLKSWHMGFYRFGMFDLSALSKCVGENITDVNALRERDIESLCNEDEPTITRLFGAFTTALRGGKGGLQESTVATAKALHLLAPGFMPLWDNPIAGRYGQFPMWARDYVTFCWQTRELVATFRNYVELGDDCTLLKRIDEFNYAAYTKHWIAVGAQA